MRQYRRRGGVAARRLRAFVDRCGRRHPDGLPGRPSWLRRVGRACRRRARTCRPDAPAALRGVPDHPPLRPPHHRPPSVGLAPVLRVAPADRCRHRRPRPLAARAERRRSAAAGAEGGRARRAPRHATGPGRRRPGSDPPTRRCRARAALRQWPAGCRALWARPRLDRRRPAPGRRVGQGLEAAPGATQPSGGRRGDRLGRPRSGRPGGCSGWWRWGAASGSGMADTGDGAAAGGPPCSSTGGGGGSRPATCVG